MPRPLSSYFTSSPSSSTSASATTHSRTRSHSNLDGLLPSHAAPGHLHDTWVVPVTTRVPSWDLERACDSHSPALVSSSSSHTLVHLGPSTSTPSRSLSLGRAPRADQQGLSPAAAAAAAPAASRSYRQAGLIEQGFPAPPPPLASSAASTSSTSPPTTKPQWALQQQPLTPTTSHHLPSHRQTRSVGRAAPPPPPPPPLASSSHVRVPSLSRHANTTMLGHDDHHHHQQQQHGRPRANSNSRPPMAYSPLAGTSSASDGVAPSPYGSLAQQHYGGIGAGLLDGASPMRRGISYDGPASAASSRPASLLPGAYAPSSASSSQQSMLPVGTGLPGAARDLYSPMTGVQQAAGSSSTSGSLMSGAASSTSPMAPSPRPYSPSHYAASHLGSAGYPASAPPAQRSPLLPSHSGGGGGGGAPSASSFYPQHIAQSYGGSAHSPASAVHPPLPPPSAPPIVAAGAGGKLGGGPPPATHTYPHHSHTLHHQPSLSAHLHHQHQPLHAHAQAHAHAHSASYSPGSSSAGAYAQLALGPSSSTDLRNMSLGAGAGAGAGSGSGSGAPQQQQQQGLRSPMQAPRRRKGLVRVRDGDEIERGGTTRGGQPRGRRADPAGGFVSVRPCSPSLSLRALSLAPALTRPFRALAAAQGAHDGAPADVPPRQPGVRVRDVAQPAPGPHQAEQARRQRGLRQRGLRLHPLRQRRARTRGQGPVRRRASSLPLALVALEVEN